MGLISHFFRVLVRSNFQPIDPTTAKIWKTRTTIIYNTSAFALLALSTYMILTQDKTSKVGRFDIIKPENIARLAPSGSETKIIHISGFHIKSIETVKPEDGSKCTTDS